MNQSSYQKLRKAVDGIRRDAIDRHRSDSEVIEELVKTIPRDMLIDLYKEAVKANRTNLTDAVEAAFLRGNDRSQNAVLKSVEDPTKLTQGRGSWSPDLGDLASAAAEKPITKARLDAQDAQAADLAEKRARIHRQIRGEA